MAKLFVDKETGEADEYYVCSLIPNDLTAFIKALRQKWKQKFNHEGIRFFACGEYGSMSARPHFHILLYNCPIPDLEYYKGNGEESYYNSNLIDSCWKKGFAVIGQVTAESAAYVSRYVIKKVNNDFDFDANGMEPEFLRMSRMPGIGMKFFELNYDKIYRNDEIWLSDKNSVAYKVKPPSYFDKKYEILHPKEYRSLKDQRLALAKASQAAKLSKTQYNNWYEYLKICEKNKKSQISALHRGL